MEQKIYNQLKVLFWLTFLSLVLVGLILITFSASTPVRAQANPTGTPTPNPTIVALENALATKSVEIRDTNQRIDDLEISVKDVQWKWGMAGAIAGAVITIFSWLGINTFLSGKKTIEKAQKDFAKEIDRIEKKWEAHTNQVENDWEKRSQESLNKLIERFELTNLRIRIPEKLGELAKRLKLTGLEFEFYSNLESIPLNGVIVVQFNTEDDQTKFRTFIEKEKPNVDKTAFVLYAPPNSINEATLKCYDNLVVGNFPPTIVSNILAIGRGLRTD